MFTRWSTLANLLVFQSAMDDQNLCALEENTHGSVAGLDLVVGVEGGVGVRTGRHDG